MLRSETAGEQIGAVGDGEGQDQIEHRETDLVDSPTSGGEEPVRSIMRPRT
jgi:hypothetical protein